MIVKVQSTRPDSRGKIICKIGDNNVLLNAAAVEASDRVEGTYKRLTPKRPFELYQAIDLAVVAHGKQLDKGDGSPYIRHPLRVMEAVAAHGKIAMIVAVLHDVFEDTWVTLEYLAELGASDEIIQAIDSVTRREGEAYEDLLRRARSNPLGKIVKLADNADNSNEARLSLFPAKQADYFRQKYANARRILNDE